MDTTVTFIILLGTVWSGPSKRSVSLSVVFSEGTQLLVNDEETADSGGDECCCHGYHEATGSGPFVQILSSVQLSPNPGSPHLLVCLLTGLNSPPLHVLWWVDDAMMASAGAEVMTGDGGYSTFSVWEVSASDWWSGSSYWCGTVQDRRVYRKKLCTNFM